MEDELKQLKSELAALDRKIQLELALPTPEVAEKENDGQEVNRMRKVYRTCRYDMPKKHRRFAARLGISLLTMSSSDDLAFNSRMKNDRKG